MASSKGQPNLFQALTNGQYSGDIQLVEPGGQNYLADNGLAGLAVNNGATFILSANPATWSLVPGTFKGKYHGTAVTERGYWIYKKGARLAWQAVNYGGTTLQYWNADGLAFAGPEDWELFWVVAAAPSSNADYTVKIFNACYSDFAHYQTGTLPPDPPCFVNYPGAAFACSGDAAGATVFVAQFPGSKNWNRVGLKHSGPH